MERKPGEEEQEELREGCRNDGQTEFPAQPTPFTRPGLTPRASLFRLRSPSVGGLLLPEKEEGGAANRAAVGKAVGKETALGKVPERVRQGGAGKPRGTYILR